MVFGPKALLSQARVALAGYQRFGDSNKTSSDSKRTRASTHSGYYSISARALAGPHQRRRLTAGNAQQHVMQVTKADRVLSVHDLQGERCVYYSHTTASPSTAASTDHEMSWLRVYADACAAHDKPVSGLCAADECLRDATHAGHVSFRGRGGQYLLPLCDRHNNGSASAEFRCSSHAAVKLYDDFGEDVIAEEYSL